MRITTSRGPLVTWRPTGYQGSQVVIYVHGFGDTLDSAIASQNLFAQFARSGVQATYIVPAARTGAQDTVKFGSLTELLELAGAGAARNVTAIAHSGGNAELRRWIDEGDPRLKNIILLDALYRGYDTFKRWGLLPGRWMALVGKSTAAASRRLAGELGAPYYQGASHMGIVTREGWIQRLLAAAPIPRPLPGLVVLAVAGAIGYGIYRFAR